MDTDIPDGAVTVGVVEIEHSPLTTNDHLACTLCDWQLGVSPRQTALRLATRHDASHQTDRPIV